MSPVSIRRLVLRMPPPFLRLKNIKKSPTAYCAGDVKQSFDRDRPAHSLRFWRFRYPYFENAVFKMRLGFIDVQSLRQLETPREFALCAFIPVVVCLLYLLFFAFLP